MGSNINRFMTGLQTQITVLCRNISPIAPPGSVAWPWFRADSGTQQPEVNAWVEAQLDLPAVKKFDTTWKDVGRNGKNYWTDLSDTINAFAAQRFDPAWTWEEQATWLWFHDLYWIKDGVGPESEADAPKEVIDWVKPRLPGATPPRSRRQDKPSRRKDSKPEIVIRRRAVRRRAR